MDNVDTMQNGCREIFSNDFMFADTSSETPNAVNANRRDR